MEPLKLAVVGHTNTGKTSLLRTILHDSDFGEVASRPSTTRDVIRTDVVIERQMLLQLFDTPGLEAGTDLYEKLNRTDDGHRHDGPAHIQAFLQSPEAATDFDQEAKVLRQMLQVDAALYVVDVRDPVLPKFQDELAVLTRCGKPILPVLNFVAQQPNHRSAWQQALSNINLHVQIEFDAVTPPIRGEVTLCERLAALLPAFQPQLEAFANAREEQRLQRWRTALHQLAELLVDVAAYHYCLRGHELEDEHQQFILKQLQASVKRREEQCVQELLALYAFERTAVELPQLHAQTGQWRNDLFAAHTFAEFGIKTGLGVGSGAAVGAGVDVLVGGLSLGAGTAIGAVIGGVWQGWNHYGRRLLGHLRGERELIVNDQVVHVLCLRQLGLIERLAQRGHGAQSIVQVQETSKPRQQWLEKLLKVLSPARKQRHWSSMHNNQFVDSKERQQCVEHVRKHLEENWSA